MGHSLRELADIIQQYPKLLVLTGAGISAPSGIPTYRDHQGTWLHRQPIQHREFLDQPAQRQRYWARSMLGWQNIVRATPNAAHLALVQLQRGGFIVQLITQNVDNLHQRAGHENVIDLHGNLTTVFCVDCGARESRSDLQQRLHDANPRLQEFIQNLKQPGIVRPDGDADIDDFPTEQINVPDCGCCRGTLMPDVVFFGGTVPKQKILDATQAMEAADALLIIGSSLKVFSGFRFCRLAAEMNKPILMINQGLSRADDMLRIKVELDCVSALPRLLDYLQPQYQC